jgi:Fuc2NAc and GlcNAc transferase
MVILFLLLTFLFSLSLTWLTRLYAIKKNILDIPNQRSSHQVPTPRGGGLAIVVSFLVALCGMYWAGYVAISLFYALLGGGIAIAAIGYADDVFTVSSRYRALTHILAAVWAVYWLHGFPTLDVGTWQFTLNKMGAVMAVIGIVWCINFYNFMDGIDGLAGAEGVLIAVASSLAVVLAHNTNVACLLLFFAASIAGFTTLNWPPAKIFMGDIGSGFIGFVFGVMAISTSHGLLNMSFWLIIMAVFICDATFTLILRAAQGKRWYAAHREHAYQHLTALGATHKQVTLGITLLNLLVLLPLALLTQHFPALGAGLLGAVTLSLLIAWITIKWMKLEGVQREANITIS